MRNDGDELRLRIHDFYCMRKDGEERLRMSVSKVKGFCRCGRLSEALELLEHLGNGDAALGACDCILEASKSVSEVRHVHSHMVMRGFESSSSLSHILLFRAYQDMVDAEYVFRASAEYARLGSSSSPSSGRSRFESCCIQERKPEKALELCIHMIDEGGAKPDEAFFIAIAKSSLAQSNAAVVERMLTYIWSRSFPVRPHLCNMLLGHHLKCGRFDDAWQVFHAMPRRDVVTWTTMISGHSKQGKQEQALQLFEQMQKEGSEVDAMAVVSVLAACVGAGKLEKGRHIHASAICTGKASNMFVANTLLDLYATWGSREEEGENVMAGMLECDAVTWNIRIAGKARKGRYGDAVEQFWRMSWEGGVAWTSITFLNVLEAVGELGELGLCRRIHAVMLCAKVGGAMELLQNALVHAYAKCGGGGHGDGGLGDAQKIFAKISRPDTAAWSSMISAYSDRGLEREAWDCFCSMVSSATPPSHITYVLALGSCSDIDQIRKVFDHLRSSCVTPNVFVHNAAMAAYTKLGRLDLALREFEQMEERNVVSWTSLLSAHVKQRRPAMAVELFGAMEVEGVMPNEITYLCLLSACTALRCLELSRRVHDYMVQAGGPLESDAINDAMVDVYIRCGSLEDSCGVLCGGEGKEGEKQESKEGG